MTTQVPSNSPLAIKNYSAALFALVQREHTLLKNLTGPAPKQSEAESKLRAQTFSGMPVVRVVDLAKGQGDKVSIDLVNITVGRPLVGDVNREGTGEKLTFDSMDIALNTLSKVIDCGGKMTQQRTRWALDKIAIANGTGYMARMMYQKMLVHMCGARGSQGGTDWVIPSQSDSEFAAIMINPVMAPSYNRHYVWDATNGLSIGGAELANITTADTPKLQILDDLRKIIDDSSTKLQPVKLPDDPAADGEPMWVFLMTPLAYAALLTDTGTGNVRTFHANAFQRAQWGSKHPLFQGEVGMWNGILARKMDRAIRFLPNEVTNIITAANRYTGTETTQAVNSGLTAGWAVERCVLLGAQALGHVYGQGQSGASFAYKKRLYNFEDNMEVMFSAMCGMSKVRFKIPDGLGNNEPTDHGIYVVDVAVKLPA